MDGVDPDLWIRNEQRFVESRFYEGPVPLWMPFLL